ncbi:nuclear pore complex protein NUP62-like [Pollicipes pollicipes]|uniref:nuclear pore complex protein NUP62-like n=1 Tax=Pollicipes pollicipes TaxID=41117 RepID=UPI0018851E24|nr:nuclear pore complex protein NUP62-like [Pollicipes pollicipes]
MAEVAASRPSPGLSLSAENLHALEPAAALDDLVESEVIVGDDSDDEFAFNGEVKDTEEIYIQNGPRGPSMTVGHVTIEHSYCTPDDDEAPVKLVDPDRFSEFFLMDEAAPPTAAGVGSGGGGAHVQLFSDMRQCVSGGGVSYLQVSSAVLSSLQQGARRLESLTEEDETEAAQEAPPGRCRPPRADADAAAPAAPTVSDAPTAGESTASGDGAKSAAMSTPDAPPEPPPPAPVVDVWGAGVGVCAPAAPVETASPVSHAAPTDRVSSAGPSAAEPAVAPTDPSKPAPPSSATGASDPVQSAVPAGGAEPAGSDSISLVSPVEPSSEISGPVSLVGIVLPSTMTAEQAAEPAAAAGEDGRPHDARSDRLWGAAGAAAVDSAPLPVLKIDESVESRSDEPESVSSDRSSPPRSSRDGLAASARRPPKVSPRGSLSARAKVDLAKTRPASATREEKRTLTNYGTLPRSKGKKPLPADASKREDLPAVSEITKKRDVAAKPASAKPALSLKRKPLDKKVAELKKSESAPEASDIGGGDGASYGTLGRRRKTPPDAAAELKKSADKYGTLTRKKKEPKTSEAAAAISKSATFTSEELKRSADTFATLGRRKKTPPPAPAAKPDPPPKPSPPAARSAAAPPRPNPRTEERADKLEVQEELGRTTVRVQEMMSRMEGDLEKSVAAQKTLLQQVQETEAESFELHEFMQLEKNALVDALREAENETPLIPSERAAREEMLTLKAELRHVQSRTKELLLTAGSNSDSEAELRERLAQLEAENVELRRQQSHTADNETASLRQELQKKDRQLEELKQKYTKHKQILTENVQKAESEIQTLDEIIDYVIVSLGAVPELVQKESVLWKLWLDLDGPNKTITKTKLNGTSAVSDLNANADIVKV